MTNPTYRITPCQRDFTDDPRELFYILEQYTPNRFFRGGRWHELGRHSTEADARKAMGGIIAANYNPPTTLYFSANGNQQ